MPTPERCGVLLDVDGTLVDSNYLHALAWWRALRDAGESVPMHRVHRLIGMGSDQLLPRLIGRRDDAIDRQRGEYFKALMPEVVACPGATDLVRSLHDLGLVTVLATSSSADDVDELVELLDIGPVVDVRTTVDDVERTKPDPEVFVEAMRRAQLASSCSIAVGDSRWDVEASLAAGVACIGVETGGTTRQELLDAGAIAVYSGAAELLSDLGSSPIADLVHH